MLKLAQLEKDIFDQDNYLVKKMPPISPLPFSIVATSVGEHTHYSAEERAKIDLITSMCMNVGGVKRLKNDPQIDAMLESEM